MDGPGKEPPSSEINKSRDENLKKRKYTLSDGQNTLTISGVNFLFFAIIREINLMTKYEIANPDSPNIIAKNSGGDKKLYPNIDPVRRKITGIIYNSDVIFRSEEEEIINSTLSPILPFKGLYTSASIVFPSLNVLQIILLLQTSHMELLLTFIQAVSPSVLVIIPSSLFILFTLYSINYLHG